MTARGVIFLEAWIGDNVPVIPSAKAEAGMLAAKLVAAAAAAGFTLADMELSEDTVEDYIRQTIANHAEPGTPGD